MDGPMSDPRSPPMWSDLLFRLVRDGRLAMPAAQAFPGWKRALCRQHGLVSGAIDVAHYARAAGRAFSSPEDAAFHYLALGSARGWSPSPGFSPETYRRENPDTVVAGYEPFSHWLRFGRSEGREAKAAANPAEPDIRRLLERPRTKGASATVDVVVPVHGSRSLALSAIASVLEAPTREVYELVVVDDASPDPLLRRELGELARAGLITLLVNERNIGFVGSVNRGMGLHPDRDVVLLNSDTRVFGDWLDRLMAALRTPATATVTPLSNAATILSYPCTLCENPVPPEDAAEWDRLCADIGLPTVEIPTAVGFCMAIRRACLVRIGTFDQDRFGQGYGEENDFCLRAAAAGWRHLAAPNLFVWHRAGASFGEKRGALIAAAQGTIEALHPGYAASVGAFIRRDPLLPVRRALDIARIRADPRSKWLCLHSVERAESRGALAIELVPDLPPYAGQFRLVPVGIAATPNLPRSGRFQSAVQLAGLLRDLGIQLFHEGEAAGSVEWRRQVRRAVEMSRTG